MVANKGLLYLGRPGSSKHSIKGCCNTFLDICVSNMWLYFIALFFSPNFWGDLSRLSASDLGHLFIFDPDRR